MNNTSVHQSTEARQAPPLPPALINQENVCPSCGRPTVCNSLHFGGVGYRSIEQCPGALAWPEVCDQFIIDRRTR